jgi:hypothetical protein
VSDRVEPAVRADRLGLADGRRLFAAFAEVFLERRKRGQLRELFLLGFVCEEMEVNEADVVGEREDGVAVCELRCRQFA